MGVIRNINNSLNNNNLEDDLIEDIIDNVIDNNFDSDPELESNVRLHSSNRLHRNRENRSRRTRLRPEPTFRALGVRGKSHKKSRRYENANILPQHLDNLGDEELNEICIYDFIPETVSAFAQLLMEKENMDAFTELINCTEEQQNQILGQLNRHNDRNESHVQSKGSDSDIESDPNSEHTFNADHCFNRIDSDLKNLFKRKRIPLGVLASIEEDITDFFVESPFATYKSCLSSGFERLLLHGCCQYLDLKCLSFNAKGERWSKVRNGNHYFAQPSVMLAKYLESRYSDS